MRCFWILTILGISLLAGCGVSSQLTTPTPSRSTATLTPSLIPTQPPTSAPSPSSTPETSPEARAELVLLIVDCTWKFCPPEETEQQVLRVIAKPGIFTAAPLDELRVRVVYDPTQLTVEEVTELFADTTSLEVEQTQ